MKYIKKYESFENVLIIDLLSLCDYLGDMHSAIEKLKEFAKQSSNYNIKRDNKDFGKYFDHYQIHKSDSISGKQEDGIDLTGEAFSYQYILRNPNKNITFTFYDVNVDDERLITLSTQNKYNL